MICCFNMSIHAYIRNHLLRDIPFAPKEFKKGSIDDMRKSEWSSTFETLMRNRLVMGAYRYGKFCSPGKPRYSHIPSIIEHAKLYEKTHNTEHLVDIANLALCEFVEGEHPQKHFKAIDDGVHVCEA